MRKGRQYIVSVVMDVESSQPLRDTERAKLAEYVGRAIDAFRSGGWLTRGILDFEREDSVKVTVGDPSVVIQENV